MLNDYDGAKKSYLQDAKKWLELGIVDEIEPMAYTISCEKVSERIEFYNTLIPDYNFRMGISPRLTSRDIIIDIKQLKLSLDCNGYILFANNLYNDNEFINILKVSYNNNESIYDELIDKIEGYYSIKDNNSYIDLVSALEMENIELFRNLVSDLNNENMKTYLLKILNSK